MEYNQPEAVPPDGNNNTDTDNVSMDIDDFNVVSPSSSPPPDSSPLKPLKIRNLTPIDIRFRLASTSVHRGVVQERALPPTSPLLEPDDRDYPLPSEIPPLNPTNSTNTSPSTTIPISTPPPHIFHRILQHTHLTHTLMSHLDLPDLINLYSISAGIRAHCAARWTHMIKSWALNHTPINWAIARFKFYSPLCFPDPAGHKLLADPTRTRQVPSFRYLRMIEFREKTIRSIVRELAKEGHRLPSMAKVVLAKLWFAMNVPTNEGRARLFGSRAAWTNEDLFVASMFFIKLEMRLTDPKTGGRSGMFKDLWLAQRGLAPLAEFLRRERVKTEGDLIAELAHWRLTPMPQFNNGTGFLGSPFETMGSLSWEKWLPVVGQKRLFAVNQFVAEECARRNMGMSRYYLSIMMWGYVDGKGRNVDTFLKEDDDDEDAFDDVMPPIRAPPLAPRRGQGGDTMDMT